MRRAAAICLFFCLAGCTDLYAFLFDPSDEQVAQQCGVSTAELRQMKGHVKKLRPYDGRKLGKCDLIKDDSGYVFVATIEHPPAVR